MSENIEEVLKETADFFEALLSDDKILQLSFGTLLMDGQAPSISRTLKDLKDAEVVIVVRNL